MAEVVSAAVMESLIAGPAEALGHGEKRAHAGNSPDVRQAKMQKQEEEKKEKKNNEDKKDKSKKDNQGNQNNQERPTKQQKTPKKKANKKFKANKLKKVTDGSVEEVLMADVQALLTRMRLGVEEGDEVVLPPDEAAAAAGVEEDLPAVGAEIDLEIVDLSSTGDGLGVWRQEDDQGATDSAMVGDDAGHGLRTTRRIYVVSFAVPGDIVRARVFRHLPTAAPGSDEVAYSVADVVQLLRPSPTLRDATTPRERCRYFARCGGCQYQMLDYDAQLRIKRRVVERAFRHFSGLPAAALPPVTDTMPSPLTYGYRTKLTPHFDGPPGFRRRNPDRRPLTAVPDIGFMQRGSRATMDIEECPIGTPAIAAGLARERARVARTYGQYVRGATILLRESTQRCRTAEAAEAARAADPDAVAVQTTTPTGTWTDVKTCTTENLATTTEYVDDYVFTNPAGSFFQNNNSILPGLTAYVRDKVQRPATAAAGGSSGLSPPLRYLVDAYSGSGLFTIALASTLPGGSIGIDIAEQSIAYARRNATLNGLAPDRCRFLAADAAQLFASVSGQAGPSSVTTDPDETVVVLDPPRKGCDAPFLRQLLAYGPARIVYVSCNVHTQARDVGMLVRGRVDAFGGAVGPETTSTTRYALESLRGFDFFPQTAHVEGIAVLNRVDS